MSETLVNPNNYASLANYDDYGDTNDLNLLSGIKKTTLDRLGGHGHGHGINETLLLLLIGGLIGGGILLLLKIKAAAGRSFFQDEGILGSLMSGHLTERILVQSTHSSDPSRINGEISNLNLGNEGESTF
ncbi:unnamed protein product [Lepeophtheirus salmonis]|uniref:(salmon louse) hypothetical protein n=1 Tax=Lepeophtheirus salmonis TaxID=72036 RepID=A0A7R8D3B8_LEPSM|nr:unnamed protein product [Lepeophtheirus salmonis]CAF3009143.1 unnamed protein product [Lepeophtheirus salmonis]